MPDRPLQITVIGAGISGLTFGLAALQSGHAVTLLEKSSFLRETGAAFHVGCNATAILKRLGVDIPSIGGNVCRGMVSIDGLTGQLVKEAKFDASRYKEPWYLVHRVDLHDELRRKVIELGGRLELGIKIASVDAEKAVVKLEDGRVFEGDVVIGADGNRSVARECLNANLEPFPFGTSCYRWLVDRETLLNDPETKGLVAKRGFFEDLIASDRKMVAYPCRHNNVFNLAGFVPSEETTSGDDWNQQGNKEKLLKSFESFHPNLLKLASHTRDDLKVWQLMDMKQLERFNTARLAVIGDAAHPFLPFLGQGAAQAIEDSIAAAIMLGPGTSPAEVPELLGLYDSIRRERVHYVQAQTRRNGQKPQPPPKFLFEMVDYCHLYDVQDDATQRLMEWRKQRSGKDVAEPEEKKIGLIREVAV